MHHVDENANYDNKLKENLDVQLLKINEGCDFVCGFSLAVHKPFELTQR